MFDTGHVKLQIAKVQKRHPLFSRSYFPNNKLVEETKSLNTVYPVGLRVPANWYALDQFEDGRKVKVMLMSRKLPGRPAGWF